MHKATVLTFAALAPLLAADNASACWMRMEQEAIAAKAPVVVSGKIIRIDSAAAEARGRVLDVAHLKVSAVHKNELKDVPDKPGGVVKVRMNSAEARTRASTDIRYPEGTEGIWYLYLRDDGELYVNAHPQQYSQAKNGPKLAKEAPNDGKAVRLWRTHYIANRRDVAGREVTRTAAFSGETAAALQKRLAALEPGTLMEIDGGAFDGPVYLRNLRGTAKRPIIIRGKDPDSPPVIRGRGEGLHLVNCAYVTIAYIKVTGAKHNGINIDDGGDFSTPAEGIVIRDVTIEKTGPRGNFDGLKLSGVTRFRVERCRIAGWGGSAVDMVGCHDGEIDGCTFRGLEGFSQHTGVQAKGGSTDVLIHRNTFLDAGGRAVNCGGSTGLKFFRPKPEDAEARQITIAGNRFVGSRAPVAFVTARNCAFRRNTVVLPGKWALRILQETTDGRFKPSGNNRVERNLFVLRSTRTAVNIGPRTAPQTFTFRGNAWYVPGGKARPDLPGKASGNVLDVDPKLKALDSGAKAITSENPHLEGIGARGYEPASGNKPQTGDPPAALPR